MKTLNLMKRLTQTATEAALTGLPSDLSLWVDKTSLVSLVLDAVQDLPWPNATVTFDEADDRAYRPQMLMTLLTYSYATGLCDSQEIERNSGLDPTLRYLCAGDRPSWQTLARFRRANRSLLERALASVFAWVWELRPTPRLEVPGTRLLSPALSTDRGLPRNPRCEFLRLARARVEQAVLLDSMERDL